MLIKLFQELFLEVKVISILRFKLLKLLCDLGFHDEYSEEFVIPRQVKDNLIGWRCPRCKKIDPVFEPGLQKLTALEEFDREFYGAKSVMQGAYQREKDLDWLPPEEIERIKYRAKQREEIQAGYDKYHQDGQARAANITGPGPSSTAYDDQFMVPMPLEGDSHRSLPKYMGDPVKREDCVEFVPGLEPDEHDIHQAWFEGYFLPEWRRTPYDSLFKKEYDRVMQDAWFVEESIPFPERAAKVALEEMQKWHDLPDNVTPIK